MTIALKRIYEPIEEQDGYRVLVDRLWPRGIRKNAAAIDLWLKDIAPSTALRQWFNHDPKKWDDFKARYFVELDDNQEYLQPLLDTIREGNISLIYSSRDEMHNQAVALREYLETLIR
ncbi:MAG: DUF488 domain-containing protein [Anaerolineae bacterium]|nr:DUF488 domain-containing protein [Anaerolineae bacterium]